MKENRQENRLVIDRAFVRRTLPVRDADTNKGSFGHAYLLVGSERYPGAAALASEAALYMGAGYVTLLSSSDACRLALARTPSLLAAPLEIKKENLPKMKEKCKACFSNKVKNSLLIGCGIGRNPTLLPLLFHLFETEGAPLVLDADALNLLSEVRSEALPLLKAARRELLLTPHPLEFSRLSGLSVEEIQKDRVVAARSFAEEYGVHILLKGNGSVLATKDGRICLNPTGGPALSRAGSGDVLAGAIASLTAAGIPLPEAAAAAAYLHGAAGDRLARRFSDYGVLPSALPAAMAEVLCEIFAEQA